MTDQEFIEFTLGKPWEDRATGPDSYDCWGICAEYYRQVKGITLPDVKGYANGDVSIADGFFQQVDTGLWFRDSSGIVFMAFVGENPVHCGVVIGDSCLHALGSPERAGQVCLHSMRAIKRMYKRIELWEFTGNDR